MKKINFLVAFFTYLLLLLQPLLLKASGSISASLDCKLITYDKELFDFLDFSFNYIATGKDKEINKQQFEEKCKAQILTLRNKYKLNNLSGNELKSYLDKELLKIFESKKLNIQKSPNDDCAYTLFGGLNLCNTIFNILANDPNVDPEDAVAWWVSCLDLTYILYYDCQNG